MSTSNQDTKTDGKPQKLPRELKDIVDPELARVMRELAAVDESTNGPGTDIVPTQADVETVRERATDMRTKLGLSEEDWTDADIDRLARDNATLPTRRLASRVLVKNAFESLGHMRTAQKAAVAILTDGSRKEGHVGAGMMVAKVADALTRLIHEANDITRTAYPEDRKESEIPRGRRLPPLIPGMVPQVNVQVNVDSKPRTLPPQIPGTTDAKDGSTVIDAQEVR